MVMHREKEKVKKITSETRFHSEMYSWKKGGKKKEKSGDMGMLELKAYLRSQNFRIARDGWRK